MYEWLRLIIGLYKRRKEAWIIYMILKSNLSTFHEILGFRMDVWMMGLSLDFIYEVKKICMDNLHDPKIHFIILSRNPRISYGCSNDRTYHWIHECAIIYKWDGLNLIIKFTTSTPHKTLWFLEFEGLTTVGGGDGHQGSQPWLNHA